MLHANSQKFVQLFLDGKLKSEIINELNDNGWAINDFCGDFDSIIDAIQSNPSFMKYDKSQIIYQLLNETSYNYQSISTFLLYMYTCQFSKQTRVPDPMWNIFINLYNQAKQNSNFVSNLSDNYCIFLLMLLRITSLSNNEFNKQNMKNQQIKYSILKSINDKEDNFETNYEKIKHRIKQIIIFIHKLFNNLSEKNKCISMLIEIQLFFYKEYIFESDFYYTPNIAIHFSQKELRLFTNILANMLIKLFVAYRNNPNLRNTRCAGEDCCLEFIVSKWYLLNDHNKQFIKDNNEQLVSILIHGDLRYCENEKELLIRVINKLEK